MLHSSPQPAQGFSGIAHPLPGKAEGTANGSGWRQSRSPEILHIQQNRTRGEEAKQRRTHKKKEKKEKKKKPVAFQKDVAITSVCALQKLFKIMRTFCFISRIWISFS